MYLYTDADIETSPHSKEKNIEADFFRDRKTIMDDLFVKNKILTVYELHLYELLKFVVKSLKGMHSGSYLISFFKYHNELRRTKNTQIKLLKEPSKKLSRGVQFHSVASIVLSLRKSGMIDENFEKVKLREIDGFYHKLRESVLLDNLCLVKSIFK